MNPNALSLYPASYEDDALIKRHPECVVEAWKQGASAKVVSDYIHSLCKIHFESFDDSDGWRDITWRLSGGEVRMFQLRGKVLTLEAAFLKQPPCATLSSVVAVIAMKFELCALSARESIRKTTVEEFAAAVMANVTIRE
jgi:hypothetical protein